jgi:hypothetical protein
MLLSLLSSSLYPWLVTLLIPSFHPSIHLSLGLPFLRFSSESHSRILLGNLFHVIHFTYLNYCNSFSSVTCNIFFPTTKVFLMVSLRKFSSLGTLSDMLEKSILVASSLLAWSPFRVCVSAPNIRKLGLSLGK